MGLIYIWWEQPALTLCIALLMGAGLLLARSDVEVASEAK
jgi:hypothetical protein